MEFVQKSAQMKLNVWLQCCHHSGSQNHIAKIAKDFSKALGKFEYF
jgi:hypothetical protein